jgi:hypothetical protein
MICKQAHFGNTPAQKSNMRPNCHISERVKGCCDICECWPAYLHMPEDLHGWYCPDCCPACKVQPIAANQLPVEAQQQPVVQAA